MAAITSANVANAIVKLVAADALPALMGNLVMGNLVNRDFEPTLAQAGDTVNVPIPPTLVANNLAEGGTVQTQNPNLGNAQIVLNTHAEATFQIPDVTKVLAVPDLLSLYMQPAVVALAEKIETDLMALYSQFTANTPVGGAATPITEAISRRRGDGAVPGEGAGEPAEVPGGGREQLTRALRQIPRFSEFGNSGRGGSAGAGGRHGREDQGLLRVPFAVRGEDRIESGLDAQPGVRQERDRPGGSPTAAAAAGDGRGGGVRGAGQLRDAGGDDATSRTRWPSSSRWTFCTVARCCATTHGVRVTS